MKNKIKNFLDLFVKNRKVQIAVALILVVSILVVTVNIVVNATKNVSLYRETTASVGNLTVGITENGTVDIGTIEQTFDLDMSELERVTTNNSSTSQSSTSSGLGNDMQGMMAIVGGNSSGNSSSGGNIFSQMFNLAGNNTSTQSTEKSDLVIESVNVSVGQKISAGDVILTLESEGVEKLKTELSENVEKVTADMEALVADQELSRITAEYTLKSSLAYGKEAGSEKDASISSLQAEINTAKETLDAANKSLANYEEQLVTAKADYENAKIVLSNAEWVIDNTNKYDDTGNYVSGYELYKNAKSNADSLESKIEQLEMRIENAKSNVKRAESNLTAAKRNYDSGKITADEDYELKMLAYETAQETYDITIAYLEDDLAKQQKKYDETIEKWDEFNSYIDGVNVVSKYDGIITSIEVKKGEQLNTGAVVVKLYDANDITMTVSIDEDDMADISVGGIANVSIKAYPDEVFEAEVTEIGDASTDSSGNVTYDVTVKINADVTKLFQGMSAEVTFITKQSTNVLYVNNRAIIREDGTSYVKIKDEKGSISKVKVITGFSDGVNVEILDGLEEGQVLVIEKGDN